MTTETNLKPEEHLTTGGFKLEQVDTTSCTLFHMLEFNIFRKDDQILQEVIHHTNTTDTD